jgi:hypothetical protein
MMLTMLLEHLQQGQHWVLLLEAAYVPTARGPPAVAATVSSKQLTHCTEQHLRRPLQPMQASGLHHLLLLLLGVKMVLT